MDSRKRIEIPDCIIAIDGFSSCGKSTIAKDIADILKYTYIDTGAMYRAATLYFLNLNISPEEIGSHPELLEGLQIQLISEKELCVILNNEDVTEAIREPFVASFVSQYSVISQLRKKLVHLQQLMGAKKRIVMDGRDIGTVVFPNAEFKFFVTADLDIRSERRRKELQSKGILLTLDEVKENLSLRDHIDATRHDSPLKRAEDSILIDTSYLSREEQLEFALSKILRHQ